ncbi:MAG: DUF92 domain-containing protein [Gammaproteobacteria bacterium]
MSKRAPRLMTTGQVVAPGTSGGISAVGIWASLMGGASIGLAAGWLFPDLGWPTALILTRRRCRAFRHGARHLPMPSLPRHYRGARSPMRPQSSSGERQQMDQQ